MTNAIDQNDPPLSESLGEKDDKKFAYFCQVHVGSLLQI